MLALRQGLAKAQAERLVGNACVHIHEHSIELASAGTRDHRNVIVITMGGIVTIHSRVIMLLAPLNN